MMDLTQVRQAQRTITEAARADFVLLVQQYTDGVELDPMAVIKRLEAAGETVDTLEAASVKLVERRKLVELAARMPALQLEQDKAEAEIVRLSQEWTDREREYRAEIAAASDHRNRLATEWGQCHEAAHKLRATCADVSLLEREAELLKHQRTVGAIVRELSDQLDHPGVSHTAAQQLNTAKGLLASKTPARNSGGDIARATRAVEIAQARFNQLTARRDELTTTLDGIAAELQAIHELKTQA